MKDLVIIGASGFGLEVCWLATKLNYNVLGYLDDAYDVNNRNYHYDKPVLGNINEWVNYKNCDFVIAIGSPRTRKKVYENMISVGWQPSFATLIDSSAHIGHNISIGSGSIICAGVVATSQISIGKNCIINLNSTIGHECVIGDFVTIAPLVAVSGNVQLKDLVEVGTGASIRQGLIIENGSLLGMGGVLTKNIPQNSVFYGNPARFVKNNV